MPMQSSTPMHVGFTGHIATENILQFIEGPTANLPVGYGGAPLLGTMIGELLARGHRVSAFTTSIGMPISRNKWIEAGNDRFRIYYIGQRPHSFRPKFGFMGRAMDFFSVERAALIAAMRAAAPDVIHAHWSYEFGLAAIGTGLPHVVTCHDSPAVVLRYMPNLYRFVRYLMGRRCLAQARIVTAVSPYLRDALQHYCTVPVSAIQNPLPNSLTRSGRPHDPKRQVSKVFRIAMVINGWDERKNPIPALKAFQQLQLSGVTELELHLFGAEFGPNERAANWFKCNGGGTGVYFHGRTPHTLMLEKIAGMDLLLHPAKEESCPMGIAEALSLGLPVVGGDKSGGVPWVIGDGGLTTDITSPAAMAHAMRELVTNNDLYARCSQAARLNARARFDAATVAQLYEDTYHQAINMNRQ